MTRRQAKKIFLAKLDLHYRGSTLWRMRRRMALWNRQGRRAAEARIAALPPERRRHMAMIRLPAV